MAISHPEHAAVNLIRLVESLKERTSGLEKESWVDVRSGRQAVRYAKELHELAEANQKLPTERLKDLKLEIDSLERAFDTAVESHPVPSSSKASSQHPEGQTVPLPPSTTTAPPSSLPQPTAKSAPSTTTSLESARVQPGPARLPLTSKPSEPLPALQNLYADDDEDNLLPLVPKNARDELLGGVGKEKGLGFMGTSQLHDELSEQLADMSRQLKDNAVYFSKSLEDEKSLLEGAGTILEGNLDKTRSSKLKLSAVTKKTRGTTWLTLLSIGIVIFGFSWTMLLIRFS